jgi:hypothetical protein
MMDNALYALLCEIEEYLVQLIDNDPNYYNYEDVESYIKSKDSDTQCLYQCFQNLTDKFYGKENN